MAEKVKERIVAGARFDELYQRLNAAQREAVDAIEGPVMVLAGPGTGKTQVLTMRVANILRQTDMAPWNILCLTFTESAAVAMQRRLFAIIGETAYQVHISTFHSFCNDVIQEFPEKFTFGLGEVLSEVERVELFRELFDALPGESSLKPFGRPYLFLPDAIRAVALLKQEAIDPSEAHEFLQEAAAFVKAVGLPLREFIQLKVSQRDDASCERLREKLEELTKDNSSLTAPWRALFERYERQRSAVEDKRAAGKLRTQLKNDLKKLLDRWEKQLPRQKSLLQVYAAYQKKLAGAGRFDFEDMIMRVVEAFRGDDQLLAHYQERFQYILVDEYQDTNGAQNEAVRLLGSFFPNPNVFVVGDDKQSIFRFQGASLENLLSFYEECRDHVLVVSLNDNYRSQQTVLDAAAAVIAHNEELVAKYVLQARGELAGRAGLARAALQQYAFDTEDEENYFVAMKVRTLIEQGVDQDEIAILYRFNRDMDSLLDVLLRLGVPVRLEAGENVLRDRRVRQLLQLLAYVADEQRDDVLAEILQFDFTGLDALDVLKVIHFAGRERRSLLTVVAGDDALEAAGVNDPKLFLRLARRLAQWRKVGQNSTLHQFFDTVLQESGLLDYILQADDKLPLLQRIETLYRELTRLNRVDHDLTVADFVARLTVLEESGLALMSSPRQTKKAAVRLMTAHRAKGLEFEHVFIVHLRDRHWGNLQERARVGVPPGLLKHDPIQGQENNEDERRLFYVALTRAKQQVYLSYARLDEAGRERVSSMFLREIPGEFIEEVDATPAEEVVVERLKASHLGEQAARSAAAAREDIREWLSERLDSYIMSVTHLNNYLTCPRLFYYRNLLRVPAAKTKHMAFGTAVHAALRDLLNRYGEGGVLPSKVYLQDRFATHLEREILTKSDWDDSLAVGQRALGAYYNHYKGDFAQQALTEYGFRSHGVRVGGLLLTGKLDKIEVLDGKKRLVSVVDYKTGNPDNAYKHLREDGDYRRQLVFYQLLAERSPRFEYKVIRGEIDFIQPSSRTGKFVKKKFEISPADVVDLEKTIKRVWREIKDLRFLEPDAACGECEYCRKT